MLLSLSILSMMSTFLIEAHGLSSAQARNATGLVARASIAGSLVYGLLAGSGEANHARSHRRRPADRKRAARFRARLRFRRRQFPVSCRTRLRLDPKTGLSHS
jgi:hypothetical protein